MKSIYLTGHRSFSNRGCEAIVRSTVGLLNEEFGDIEVLVPSNDIEADSKQWPESADYGVKFVQAYMPAFTRYWVNLQRLPLPALKRAGWPFPVPDWLKEQISSADAILSVGGDNYSLDYRLPSLLMGIDKMAMDLGKPVILWGASVGPFEREPAFVSAITKHLNRMTMIVARESVSHQYLSQVLSLKNVIQMPDPAFTLKSEPITKDDFWPSSKGNGVLGLNISPLIERYKKTGRNIRSEVAEFIRYIVVKKGLGVLLVPHAMPLNGSEYNNDAMYMQPLLLACSDLGTAVKMMPDLNASQIKGVIKDLRFFIGARTHATIAAISSGVPTITIAYSIKAKGINEDQFGNENNVLQISDLSASTLINAFEWLLKEENALKELISIKLPSFQNSVRDVVKRLRY